MTTGTDVKIVEARREHAPFIAWVMLAAARSHLDVGFWDLVSGGTEAETLRLLEAVCTSEQMHFTHYSMYLIAEVDGKPAAGLSGYVESKHGTHLFLPVLQKVNREFGRTDEDFAAGLARAGSIALVDAGHDPSTWVIEHVATLPQYRRQGLVDRLLGAIIERGRARGATVADIGVLMGNDRAQRAYEKAGFKVVSETVNPEFEAAYKCAGERLLRRSI
jgi:translation initiation factor 4G